MIPPRILWERPRTWGRVVLRTVRPDSGPAYLELVAYSGSAIRNGAIALHTEECPDLRAALEEHERTVLGHPRHRAKEGA